MFRSKLTLTLIALLSVLFFTRLGFWQLERAQQKQALRAAVQSRTELPPLVLHDLLSNHEELRFRKVLARGTFDPEQQILLDNRTYQGRAGYHVVTPLRLSASGIRVLVNRGWVELGRSRAELPVVPPPQGEVAIHGIIEIPSIPPNIFGMLSQPGPAWGNRWPYLDLDYFQARTGTILQSFLILQDPSDPGGLVRVWSQLKIRHETHIGYAIQWFAFAAMVLVIYLRTTLRYAEPERR